MANIIDLNGAELADSKLAYPYQALQAVVNATWNLAVARSDALNAKMDTAQTGFLDIGNAPTVSAGSVSVPSVSAPDISGLQDFDVSTILATFGGQYAELVDFLNSKFTAFIGDYFPNEATLYSSAETWLRDALADPSGLPAAVREQLFENDRSKILADSVRASDAILATFAARRYPLPPGAAASAVMQVQQKAQDQIAESSRKITTMSVENLHFAVEKSLGLRQMALSATGDYLKDIMSGPDIASRVISVGHDTKSKMISSLADFYRADAGAKDIVSKIAQYNESLQFDAATKNQASTLAFVDARLKSLISECQTLSTQAASLFNNIHASTGTSASASDSFSSTLDITP